MGHSKKRIFFLFFFFLNHSVADLFQCSGSLSCYIAQCLMSFSCRSVTQTLSNRIPWLTWEFVFPLMMASCSGPRGTKAAPNHDAPCAVLHSWDDNFMQCLYNMTMHIVWQQKNIYRFILCSIVYFVVSQITNFIAILCHLNRFFRDVATLLFWKMDCYSLITPGHTRCITCSWLLHQRAAAACVLVFVHNAVLLL